MKNVLLNYVGGSFICPMWLRRLIYRFYGHQISTVYANCFLGYGLGKLKVGKGSYCNSRCFFDLGNNITIGENCCVAFGVTFINSTHRIGDKYKRGGVGITKSIFIGDGCWIGANVTILPGIEIGAGCIIGAGALVTKNCKPNGLYVGVPAKRIRDLE